MDGRTGGRTQGRTMEPANEHTDPRAAEAELTEQKATPVVIEAHVSNHFGELHRVKTKRAGRRRDEARSIFRNSARLLSVMI